MFGFAGKDAASKRTNAETAIDNIDHPLNLPKQKRLIIQR
jgi:hypothetical protein